MSVDGRGEPLGDGELWHTQVEDESPSEVAIRETVRLVVEPHSHFDPT